MIFLPGHIQFNFNVTRSILIDLGSGSEQGNVIGKLLIWTQ